MPVPVVISVFVVSIDAVTARIAVSVVVRPSGVEAVMVPAAAARVRLLAKLSEFVSAEAFSSRFSVSIVIAAAAVVLFAAATVAP